MVLFCYPNNSSLSICITLHFCKAVVHLFPLCVCVRATFLPALQFAREEGLSITLHCGEVPFGILIFLVSVSVSCHQRSCLDWFVFMT